MKNLSNNTQKSTFPLFEIDLTAFQQGIYFLNISGYKSVKLIR